MRKIIGLASIFTILILGSPLASGDWQSSVGVESFSWHEYDASETKLLEESGARLFVGFNSKYAHSGHLHGNYSVKLYGANVNYDGQTQGGTPVSTNTLYLGSTFEALYGYQLFSGQRGNDWLLSFALGHDGWVRGIQDTSGASGYNEFYRVPYTKLGLSVESSVRTKIQIGAKLPFAVRERVAYSRFITDDTGESFADLNLAPVANLSLYASVDFQLAENWDFRLFYDRYLFGASPSVVLKTQSGGNVYCLDTNSDNVCEAFNAIDSGSDSLVVAQQPESHQQTIGIRMTYSY